MLFGDVRHYSCCSVAIELPWPVNLASSEKHGAKMAGEEGVSAWQIKSIFSLPKSKSKISAAMWRRQAKTLERRHQKKISAMKKKHRKKRKPQNAARRSKIKGESVAAKRKRRRSYKAKKRHRRAAAAMAWRRQRPKKRKVIVMSSAKSAAAKGGMAVMTARGDGKT